MTIQPDILFVMSDQHRGDALSCEGNSAAFTPNLDALAGHGVRFCRAYSTCPSCIPSRRALLTGKFPANNGLAAYEDGHRISSPTLPQVLRDGGYQTALIGRHMHQFPATARYGYEHQCLDYTQAGESDYLRDFRRAHQGVHDITSLGLSSNGWTARPWPWEEELHPTAWTVNRALEFLVSADETRPLFLTVSFRAPHPPLLPPRDCYENACRRASAAPAIGDWAVPPPSGSAQEINSPQQVFTGEAFRMLQGGYHGSIEHLDAMLNPLLAAFHRSRKPLGRPFVIVYTSDHGDMLGDHFLFRKTLPYEGSVRIPFLIQGSPDLGFQAGAQVSSPVCLEDLFPTLCAAAEVPAPACLDGENLLPVLRGEAGVTRTWLHGEHADFSGPTANHFLTDGRWKYIHFSVSGREHLFDLANDPRELRDLVNQPPHKEILKHCRENLAVLREGTMQGHDPAPASGAAKK